MMNQLRPAIILTASFVLITGLVYPLATIKLAQVIFPVQANGSLIKKDGIVIGSHLIGQSFTSDRYFYGRT